MIRHRWGWGALLIGLCALYMCGTAATFAVAASRGASAEVAGPLMMVFGGVGLAAAVKGSRIKDSERRAWRLIAVSFALLLATLVLFLIPGGKTTFPAPADATRLGLVLALIAASHYFPLRKSPSLERRITILDTLTVVAGASMVLWYFIVGPVLTDSGTAAAAAATYAIVDMILLFGFVRVLIRGADGIGRRPVLLLASAALPLTASDAFLGYRQAHQADDHRTSAIQLTCIMTMTFFMAAAAVERCRRLEQRQSATTLVARPIAAKLPYLAVAGGWTMMIITASHEQLFPWTGLVSGGLAITGFVVLRQITIQRANEVAAATDELTGLVNRSRFRMLLTQALRRGAQTRHSTAVLLIDMNGFKNVNDTLGHMGGDRLLASFSLMLSSSVRQTDVVGRLGGDEFAVVLHDIDSPDDIEAALRRVVAATTEPVYIDGNEVLASASIGIARSSPGQLTPDEILHRADLAMYEAKRKTGQIRWSYWAAASSGADKSHINTELHSAFSNGDLHLVYQPVVSFLDAHLHGAEVRARWQHPQRGEMDQDAVLSLAEHAGMREETERWIVEKVAERARTWRLPLYVSISPQQLESAEFCNHVLAACSDPHRLVLQVADGTRVAAKEAVAHMETLRAAGVRFALEGFGTGESSLVRPARIPIDVLKLDQGFISALDGSPRGDAPAQAVIHLGQNLELTVIAEGVQTQHQANQLIELGCPIGSYQNPWITAEQVEALTAFQTTG